MKRSDMLLILEETISKCYTFENIAEREMFANELLDAVEKAGMIHIDDMYGMGWEPEDKERGSYKGVF